jgi:nicotinate phosphoribosyltransferase
MESLIPSMLWDDLYKMTMCQAIFFQFPRVKARYKFYDRQPDRPYPPGFAKKLQKQINKLANVKLTIKEEAFLNKIRFLYPNFVEWFRGFRYDPTEVTVTQDDGGKLDITIEGLMYRCMWWEIKILLLVSTMALEDTPIIPDKEIVERTVQKADKMTAANLHFIDMATRRARSPFVHELVVKTLKPFAPFMRGTSNMYLAMENDLTPIGTVAHEWFMLHQALYGFGGANYNALENWVKTYDGDLGIVLPDTLTTDVFLKSLTRKQAELWKGFRPDSGDMLEQSLKIAHHIKTKFQIDPETKIWIPSDGLNDVRAIEYQTGLRNAIGSHAMVTAGMGGFLGNDVAPRGDLVGDLSVFKNPDPRKIVIKLDAVDVGNGWFDVIKLSDEPGKFTGKPRRKEIACEELGINC